MLHRSRRGAQRREIAAALGVGVVTVDLVTIRELTDWSEKGGLNLVQRYAHVGDGLKRAAVEALAQGERLVRTDNQD